MPTDGYMDAAAVPVPDAGDDAFALNLHGELANHRLTTPVQCACGWREPDTEDRTWSRHVRDALLPLIREHVAEAWDEGYEVGCADTPWEDGATEADRTPNPYREVTRG